MNLNLLVYSTLGLVGLAILVLPMVRTALKSTYAFLFVLINAISTSALAVSAISSGTIEIHLFGGSVLGNISLRIDSLAAWFIIIVNIISVNGALYGIGYLKSYEDQSARLSLHWISFVIFHTSMIWVCMLQHVLVFLVAWEIMSLSSLMLVIFEHGLPKTQKAGLNYLIQMHVGVAFLSVAFIWVLVTQHSYDFTALSAFFAHNKPLILFFLFFAGFGIKAGFIPLHTWLPHAHPAAPSHVSGVMSGVIVKMGIYGILRIVTYLSSDLVLIGGIVLVISTLTALFGILNSAVHRDLKRMLAFCTIENIGIIGMGIGLGMIGEGKGFTFLSFVGYAGALLHTLNHSLYKSALFFTAGNIYKQTHTRNMEHLGGLIKSMPATALVFLCGALAIGGLPPFNGFISEFLIYTGFISGIQTDNLQLSSLMIVCLSSLALVGGISVLAFTKAFGVVFLGSPRIEQLHPPKEVPVIMQIPLYFSLLLMVLIGIFPNIVFRILPTIMAPLYCTNAVPHEFMFTAGLLSKIGISSLVLLLLVLAIFLIRQRVTISKPVSYGSTWGCGYVNPSPKLQYTAKSYSKSMAKLFSFVTFERKKYKEIESRQIVPKPGFFQSFYLEFFEHNIISRMVNVLLRFMDYFSFIHNGKIQMYVLYGVFFVVLIIIASLMNIL